MAIKAHGIAIGWELTIALDSTPLSIHFTGGLIGEEIVIVGARTNTDILNIYKDLLQLDNEQINALRPAMQAQYDQIRRTAQQDSSLYDEVTRLNNDIMVAQRALAKANFELEQLNALKNQFLGMAAHDLRSPLGAILTYSDFLIDEAGAALTQEQQQFLAIIQSSSNYMLTLVNDLLDVAIIESGKLQLELAPTNMLLLVRNVVTVQRVLAVKKDIAIELLESPIPTLLVDALKIEQVMYNLLGNAMKFSPPHTKITVIIEHYPGEVHILVSDQGSGIPDNERGKLFNLFGKTSVRSTAGEKSSGLGLAIAKRIIEGHGGRIWVEDCVIGKGATFVVSLLTTPGSEVQ